MRLASRGGLTALAISLLSLSACVSTSFRPSADFEPRQGPPVSPDSVRFLRAAPTRPYVTLGEIEGWVTGFPSQETAARKAREAAAAVGADAILPGATNLFAEEPNAGDGAMSVGTRAVSFTVTAIRYVPPKPQP